MLNVISSLGFLLVFISHSALSLPTDLNSYLYDINLDSRSDQSMIDENADNDVIIPPPALYDSGIDDVMYDTLPYGSNDVSLYGGNEGGDDVMYDGNYEDNAPNDDDVIDMLAMNNVMKIYDLNEDGVVSMMEFAEVTRTPLEEAIIPFQIADLNDDGVLSEDELFEAPWLLENNQFSYDDGQY